MREEWIALAERIEKSTKPNREIDARISVAVGAFVMKFSGVIGKWAFWTTPVEPNQFACLSNVSGNEDDAFRALSEFTFALRYTGSIDIITALIEREFPNSKWAVLRRETGTKAMLDPIPAKDKIDPALRTAIYADAETPALALCAVFCRSMSEKKNNLKNKENNHD